MESIVQAISSVGFPIVAFLLLFLKLEKSLNLLKETVNNNTVAIQVLLKK